METNAHIFTVPQGFKFQCQDCHAILDGNDGDKCGQLDDDSSTMLCLDCLGKRQRWAKEHTASVGPTEHKRPRRSHRRDAVEWMEYD